jgi:ATP-dependent DNA helicase RecQ
MKAESILLKYFHFSSFRPLQAKIVRSIMEGNDTFALLPTGGGKSLCYQVPGLHFYQNGGITIVVSPLIALMKDQVDNLLKKNISATFINHSLSETEVSGRLAEIAQGKYAFIYVSPERLMIESFVQLSGILPIKFLAIDEAHCISQWGHDFRPEYSLINKFIQRLPHRPIVAAFTATAPPAVKKEVISSLKLQKPSVFQDSFFRSNLHFCVIPCSNSQNQERILLHLAQKHQHESGIIYCSTRNKTEHVCQVLRHFGVACAYYHGGIEAEERTKVQDDFLQNKIKLISATNAFGMGVDKPDIAFVIHFNFPGQLEAYYQEAGRAGRNGEKAYCYLLFREEDIRPHLYLITKRFESKKNHRLREVAKGHLLAVIEYITTHSCRTSFLLKYLGEKKHKRRCSNCDVCQKSKDRQAHQSAIRKKLYRIKERLQKRKYFYPVLSSPLIEYLCFLKPQTRNEYLQVPGIGKGWIEKYYAFFAVELLSNVLQN